MFQFKISSLEDSDAIISEWATKCITILGPEFKKFYKSTPDRLSIFFDDIDFQPKPGSKWVAPKLSQIKTILNFSKSFNDSDRLLVHCKAGISRSTAVLIGILIQHGLKPEEALEQVRQVRPELWPNNMIIGYLDAIFQLDSNLISVVREFKEQFTRQRTLSIRESIRLIEELEAKDSTLE